MYNAAPRSDVGGGGLAGALMVIFALVMNPTVENFDFNLIFGAFGVALPFLAGYMPRKWKTIYMSLVGVLAVVLTAVFEFLILGSISEGTKSIGLTALTTVLVAYLKDPVWPDPPADAAGEAREATRRKRDAR